MHIVVKYCEQGLDEVLFRQFLAAGVHPDKYVGDVFLIRLGTDTKSRKRVYLQIEERVDVFFDSDLIVFSKKRLSVLCACIVYVLNILFPEFCYGMRFVSSKDFADGADVFRAALISLRPDFEIPVERVERYLYITLLVILILDLDAFHSRQKGRKALLAVDHKVVGMRINLVVLADRACPVVIGRRLPEHYVADREAFQHGVHQFTYFIVFPNKRSL